MKGIIMALIAISAPLPAQWLNYPTPGIPRTPDGKPNLSAPAPRTADGKIDFSGIWEMEHNRPCPPDGCNDTQAAQEVNNIAWNLKAVLPYQPWAAALAKARNAHGNTTHPTTPYPPLALLKPYTPPTF